MKREIIQIVTEFVLGLIIIIGMGLWIIGGMAWANWDRNATEGSSQNSTAISHQGGTSP